uniref:RUN domain-containing protein n=1 Tax=Denticeps clupeoides TaxID=299321 RepID=A0AAY4CNN1_9TELE
EGIMLAIETGREARDVKQWIKEELAQSLKGLHKRYVTTDAMVTSEDTEANRLCCALEAVFIHGIKSKHVRSEVGGRGRKGAGLPQPDFWGLLKSVTHRNVIQELESLSFVNSGVGRCRAWLRLALNDGLLECYLTSLLRESSKLGGFYQACALLLDPEEREVLLSLLQGLASLSFQLSYKSAMLNEWTTTPLVLAGLCPAAPLADEGRDPAGLATDRRKESWDTASQSSGGSDAAKGGDIAGRPYLNSSSLSLETTGSSALSSSLSSDSLLQGHDRDWNSPSWISEDDFTKPELSETETSSVGTAADMNGSPDSESLRSPPSVSHGRQRGQPNPFRGLLMMGQLESRSAMGMWRGHYCELSPYELRLYLNEEERSCCENCSLLRCEDVRLLADGRFHICFPGKKLYLRAASRGEAEDWVERIAEAVGKCRLPSTCNEQWEVLQVPSAKCPVLPPVPAPSAPESKPELLPPPSPLDWTRPASPEPEAIKEALVYQAPRDEQLGDGWTPLLLSLSLEALRGFRWQDGHKIPLFSHPIHSVRDVVPDTLLGGPAFFKVLTGRETTVLRAENGDEARAWRGLIRGALDSYLQTEEDEGVQGGSGGARDGGSVQRLVQHRLKGEGELMPHLFTVPTEKGLDTQSFKCAGCTKQIGFSRRKARLCEFSALYYCDSCHRGDLTAIPSRMVHNWDLTPREVSRQAMKLLAQVRHEPLLNLDLLNPDLFDHTETMATVRELRQRLRLLGDYLLICRSGVLRKIQPRLDQRTYLLDSAHLYSVMDLQQIADGQYETFLLSLIQLSSTHVHHCDLCTQRGFICQICNANNIIFPFQFDTTTRCKECKSVFHSACKAACPTCPRCARMQRYLERELQD